MTKGIVVSGEFGKILVREKSDASFELGELLIADTASGKVLLQVYNLAYGSQIPQAMRELVAGHALEEGLPLDFIDSKTRNYNLAMLKNLVTLRDSSVAISKTMPTFFSSVREVTADDLRFIIRPSNPLFLGRLRSGSKTLDVDICVAGDKVFSHHILVAGTTGRGKSVLVKNILWSLLDNDYCGMLVLDPHDEYYGRHGLGLKDHENSKRVVYYTPKNAPPGCRTLKVSLSSIRPHNFFGVVDWSDAQAQAITLYYRTYRDSWIESVLLDKEVQQVDFHESTINVIKRRLMNILDISVQDGKVCCNGVFDMNAGSTTVDDIARELESGKVVVIDTSSFGGDVEILIGSLVAGSIFNSYKNYKIKGVLKDKPVVSIVLEEAPRVLGKEVLERGPNIFSSIAREGRKFKVGLMAITQLPSLIPREILANINTKIILGVEMKPERQAIIESASQDLSEDDRNIASLDTGEAIVTSNFLKFATPIKIPWFEDLVKEQPKKEEYKRDFSPLRA
ncbi:MAG: ATP-binding protein [Candidatus Woesearchaeota archaeon]